MTGLIAAIYRHPLKGFSGEPLQGVDLAPGQGFPHDRVYAVENGPSGFDPAAPAFVSKQKFCVLAHMPEVAAITTRFDADGGLLEARVPGGGTFAGRLDSAEGRDGLAAWLTGVLGEAARGPLRVIRAPEAHRFTDHPKGQISILNLASVRDLGERMGVEVDPLRFRANLYVEGWPAWIENDWAGRPLMLGWARAVGFKPIVRCAATHVNLQTAERDLDITRALFDHYGHMNLGLYAHITAPGRVALGDAAAGPERQDAERAVEWA